jgi:hypothetical protein
VKAKAKGRTLSCGQLPCSRSRPRQETLGLDIEITANGRGDRHRRVRAGEELVSSDPDIVRDAWAESPAGVVLSIAAAPVAVIAAWALLVVAIVALSPA